jgi:signal transduction histidine kinase
VSIPIQGLPIAAAALDRDSVIAVANDQFARLCGRPVSTCFGQRLAEMVAGPDRPAVEDAFSGLALLADRAPQRCRICALRAQPPSMWLTIDVARLGPGSAVPYLACLHAIPGRRRLDVRPGRRLRARRGRLQHAGLDSVASSTMQDIAPWPKLLMTLSHEFRGPLTAILGWTKLAERGVLPSESVSRALTVIGRNAASLSDMIENLFDLSRRATGSLAVTQDMLDLNPLAQLVVESTVSAARARNVLLTVRRTSGTLLVKGDSFRLEQVVRNLVENAIKFTPPGGDVHVYTRSEGLFAEIVVADNGLGIAPDVLPIIFEPFRHDDASLRSWEQGLSLALVRELVQLHGGDVRALSGGKGQGSTFIVTLPLVTSSVAAQKQRQIR